MKTFDQVRSHLKKRILAQYQDETEFQPAGILKYVEDLKRGLNAEIGPKNFFEMASKYILGTWLLAGLLHLAMLPVPVLADNVRPAYLELETLPSGNIRVVWKVPLGQEIPPQFAPAFPDYFKVIPPRNSLKTKDAMVETWHMTTKGKGLPGALIGIKGLEQSTMDAMVRLQFSDGSVHRVILRPTEPSSTIPGPVNGGETLKRERPLFITLFDRWRYGLLVIAAFILSLLPFARRRGIVLCTSALVVGALFGNALGRLPVYDNLWKSTTPSQAEATKILKGLMLNTYRAFMLQEENVIYHTLEKSISGDFLSEVYLQNREKLRIDNPDGSWSIIHQLDIKSIDAMTPNKDGSIDMVVQWDVYGSVYHQNHVHYRCNTYTAEVVIKPTADYWKLSKIELLDEQRVL